MEIMNIDKGTEDLKAFLGVHTDKAANLKKKYESTNDPEKRKAILKQLEFLKRDKTVTK